MEGIKESVDKIVYKEVGKFYVAVCDDEKNVCSEIETILLDHAKKNKISLEVDVFYKGEELANILQNGMTYELIYLDVNLITTTGINVGKLIRNELNNDTIQIVYISSRKYYAMQLFQTQPMDFIIKPFNDNEIIKRFDQVIKIINRHSKAFGFKIKGHYYEVQYDKILYFQSDLRKIKIVLENESIEFYGKLNEIGSRAPCTDFAEIHKSYLINCNHVTNHAYDSVVMCNGEILPVSQSRRKDVRRKILWRKNKENE